jgi:hypothetical protein
VLGTCVIHPTLSLRLGKVGAIRSLPERIDQAAR